MLNKLLFVPGLIDFDVDRNSHHTMSCSVTEQTPGSNLDLVGFLALPIALGVRNAGLDLSLLLRLFSLILSCFVQSPKSYRLELGICPKIIIQP